MIVASVLLAAVVQAPVALMPVHEPPPQEPASGQSTPPLSFEMRELTEAESAALPQGDGRDAVAFMCVPCHGVLVATSVRKTPPAWETTVEAMRVKGAKGTDEQAGAAAAYLGRYFPAVDVNTATADQIAAIAGLTRDEAAAIVAYRGDGHPIKSYTELKKVPGVDPKRLAEAKPKIVYTPK
jgi:competence protein ComEA